MATDPTLLPQPSNGQDLPPHILRLGRMMARQCKAPGKYLVELTISPYPNTPATVEISALHTIRRAEIEKGGNE